MPAFDYPLAQLQEYCGKNPRPSDFDAYWDSAVAEMKAVDAAATRVRVDFENPIADCYDYTFTGVGGARIYAKLLIPKNLKAERAAPAAVSFHGYYGASSANWTDYFTLVAAGFVVAAIDCRGQAGRSEDVGPAVLTTIRGQIIRGLKEDAQKLTYRSIFLDCAQLAGLLIDMPEVNPARVVAYGGSQGGALTLACAALEPRIVKLASAFPFLSDYYRVWEMDLAEGPYEELRTFFRQQDPNHKREKELFTMLGYIDICNLAPRIKGETLMAMSLMDKICPPSTQFAAYNNIAAKKSNIIYYDYGHEILPEWQDHQFRFLTSV